jgi:hypothetical protein
MGRRFPDFLTSPEFKGRLAVTQWQAAMAPALAPPGQSD